MVIFMFLISSKRRFVFLQGVLPPLSLWWRWLLNRTRQGRKPGCCWWFFGTNSKNRQQKNMFFGQKIFGRTWRKRNMPKLDIHPFFEVSISFLLFFSFSFFRDVVHKLEKLWGVVFTTCFHHAKVESKRFLSGFEMAEFLGKVRWFCFFRMRYHVGQHSYMSMYHQVYNRCFYLYDYPFRSIHPSFHAYLTKILHHWKSTWITQNDGPCICQLPPATIWPFLGGIHSFVFRGWTIIKWPFPSRTMLKDHETEERWV